MLLALLIAAPASETPQGGSGSLVILLPMIAMFYFLMIRPQRQKLKQHQQVMQSLALGDEVETIAGMYGTIRRLGDTTVELELAPGTVVKMSRNAIRRKVVEDTAASEDQG